MPNHQNTKYRIAICASNSASDYSGGRYHSWVMAEALAHAGNSVFYITNNKPIFYEDFAEYPSHKEIRLWITNKFLFDLPKKRFDIIVIVPSMRKKPAYCLKILNFVRRSQARLVLLNFETPNWYNSLSPVKRDPSRWEYWKNIGQISDMILSSSKEGDKFAQLYFACDSQRTRFDYCYPSINSVVAGSVQGMVPEKRIVLITRFVTAEHKGSSDIDELLCEAMKGYTLVILLGRGQIPADVNNKINHKAHKFGIKIEVKYRLNDIEKFRELKRSKLLLFPSFFEGFGLPPVEAQYCNVSVVAFDLPVLREINGHGIFCVEPGNWDQFREKIEKILGMTNSNKHLKKNISQIASFNRYSEQIHDILSRQIKKNDFSTLTGKKLIETAVKNYRFYFSGILNKEAVKIQ